MTFRRRKSNEINLEILQVEDKPNVTYNDVGGCKDQIQKLKEVVEASLLHPEKFIQLGIDPPKGLLFFYSYIISFFKLFEMVSNLVIKILIVSLVI